MGSNKNQKNQLMWKEIHESFDNLAEKTQVDTIARMLLSIREDKKELLKGDMLKLNTNAMATLWLARTMESVLKKQLGENEGALGDNFTIINENGNITIEEVK